MAQQLTLTKEGLEKLQNELEYLKTDKRKEIVESIRIARSFGDLSENSEYDEAKTQQAKVEGRIKELEDMLRNVKVISDDQISTDTVNVGAKVLVFNSTKHTDIEYTIVGSTEASPLQHKISDLSPIGKALIGHKVGESVTVDTPAGEVVLEIMSINK
ncbi:MAG: transcription elongation factor GreA [Clostridia bacterium]|nr:transcription elongation factor GreA [Clostridia bacterium]MBQ8741986.1 transcription elongation factor GreA [Clostridia bacterium]